MDAIIDSVSLKVNINGQVFQGRHVDHTQGPGMYVGTPDRQYFALINPYDYAVDQRKATLDALEQALTMRGLDVVWTE